VSIFKSLYYEIGCIVRLVKRGARYDESQTIRLYNNVVPVRGKPQIKIIGALLILSCVFIESYQTQSSI